MCLAIPMKVIEIHGDVARCEAGGIQREVNLLLLQEQEVAADDFVVVHVGYAIQKVDPQAAERAWLLHDSMASEVADA